MSKGDHMRRLVTLVLLLTLLLTSCSSPVNQPDNGTPNPGAATPDAQTGATTIAFAIWESDRANYEPLVKKFQEENPTISVVLVPLDDFISGSGSEEDTPTSTLRRIVSNADAAPAFFLPPEAYSSGLLMDLTPLMEADANFKRDDFYPGALEHYMVKDSTRVLPHYINLQLLNYNKDLFKRENLPEPKPGWSWNDMLGVAEQIAQKDGNTIDTYGFMDQSGGILPLIALLESSGVDLFNTPARDVQLARPEIVAAVKRIRDLMNSGAISGGSGMISPSNPPSGPDQPPIDPQQLIRDGKVALWASDMVSMPVVGDDAQPSDPLTFDVGSVPYPQTNLDFFSGGSDGYIISGGTEHPNEAWKWIEFLSRQQIGAPGTDSTPGHIPARQSLAEQLNYWSNISEEAAASYQWVIAHPPKQMERTPDYIGISALSQALSQVLGQNEDPERALTQAQNQIVDQIAQIQLTPTPTPDNSPVFVATPEPQEAPEGAVTVNFAVPGYSTSDVRRLLRAFREQHPDIFVKIMSSDVFTGPMELKDVARISDCFTWYATPQSDADFAALLDIQPLLEADANFPQNDYPAALMSPYRHNGGLYGLPYSFNVRTLNYNRGIFSTSGLKEPTDVWKPADFLAAAQSLTTGDGDKKQYGYVPLGGAQQDLTFFISQFGGRLMTGSGESARPNFDDPKVIEAIQWYLDLSKVHKVMPEVRFPYKRDDPGSVDNSYELIQSGRAAMWFDQGTGQFGGIAVDPGGPRRKGPGLAAQQQLDVGIAPLPIGATGLHTSDLFVRGFHISAKTQQSQACWEVMKFLTTDLTNLQGSIPARTSVASSQDFAQVAQTGLVDIYKAYAEPLQRDSQEGDDPNALYSQKMDLYWFYKALSQELDGTTSLDKGLIEAQKMTLAYVECMNQRGEAATCAKKVDPDYQGYSTEGPKG